MKILLKNATLLPEYGYGARPVSVGIRNRKIAGVWEGENADFRAEATVDCGGNLLMPAFCRIFLCRSGWRRAFFPPRRS